MSIDSDTFSENNISAHFTQNNLPFRFEFHSVLDSTNNYLITLAGQHEPEGKVVIAETQSSGRGRLDRHFFSPPGTGIYMSLLLRPQQSAQNAQMITPAAAVAVAEAIEKVTSKQAKIKWVNDIFCDGKKVCGILTETAFSPEGEKLAYAVLGIGINLKEPGSGFPEQIRTTAGAILSEKEYIPGTRNMLAAAILENFWRFYRELDQKTFLSEYKKRSMLTGQRILVIQDAVSKEATAGEIDDACRLEVFFDDGSSAILNAGEVRIKPLRIESLP